MKKIYDIDYSTEVEMPHPTWVKRYINGPIRALFVPSVSFGRDIVELIQRMDIEFETVTIDRNWDLNKWGLGDFYDKRGGIWDFDIMYQNLENALTSPQEFDVMVLPGLNGWGFFTKKTREAILQRVENGTGLVLIQPFNGKGFDKVEVLEKLSPLQNLYEEGFNERGYPEIELDVLKRDKWIPRKHFITSGIPFELFPYDELAYYPYKAVGEVIIESESGMPIAAVKEYGKGRVVAIGYFPRDILPRDSYSESGSCFDSIRSLPKDTTRDVEFDYREYFYGLIYRSMIWAARKESSCVIENTELNNERLSIQLSGDCECELYYRVKNLYDELVAEGQTKEMDIILPQCIKYGGDYRVEVFAKYKDKIADWATVPLSYPLKSKVTNISVSHVVIKPGELLTSSIDVEGDPALLEIQILDNFDRVIYREEHQVEGSRKLKIGYRVNDVNSLHIRVGATLKINGYTVHKCESSQIVVTPQNRKIEDFEVFMPPMHRGRRKFMQFLGKLFQGMGVTGLFPGDYKCVTSCGAKGLGVYWYHRADYVERKEKYLRTKDKKFLHRVPCLNDPDFWEENKRNIRKTVEENKKYGPISYFANDEGSLTCYTDELDLCFCPYCMNKMREWLKKEYRDLDHLNEVWGTCFSSWDEVVPYTYEEAIKTGNFASWGDHRRFMELTFANAYRIIRDCIREVDPDGVVRMSGCQASKPYSGYDYYQLHQFVGYFEAYNVGNQLEFHRSFAKPNTIIGAWMGYGVSGVDARYNIWHALYHGITLISIFWQYSCLNPDYTYSKSARDMGTLFKEIKREGIGKLLLYSAKRDDLGIAIHYSMPSVHGSYIRNDEERFIDNRQGWIDLLEDLGYQYNFVASQQIEQGELLKKGYKLLILPYSIAIGQKEAEEIKRFVRNGGVVIGDIQTGIMDEHCRLCDKGSLDDVFGITRLTLDARPFYINGEFICKKDFDYFDFDLSECKEFKMAEAGIRESSGKAAYVDAFMQKVASVVINEYGNGKGIYLNFALNHYPKERTKIHGGYYTRELMKRVLAYANVNKLVTLKYLDGKPVEKGYETIYYSDNNAKYVGILRKLSRQLDVGHDGLAVGAGRDERGIIETIRLELPQKFHVYDVREKRYLGFTDCTEAAIAEGDTKLFALLPYMVRAIYIDMPSEVHAGATVDVNIVIDSEKPDGEYSNVLNIKVYNPFNEFEWIYSQNISTKGLHAVVKMAIPYNEKPGQWRIAVKDVATGVQAEKLFKILSE